MRHKKTGLIIALFITLITLNAIYAELEVKTETVSAMAIPELNLPALFNLNLINKGEADTFNIDTRVVLDIEPKEDFFLDKDESKDLTLKIYPLVPMKVSPEYITFQYRINSGSSSVQLEELSMSVVKLKDAFNFYIEDINPDSEVARVHFNNKAGHNFEKVNLELSSALITESVEFSLNAYEEKVIEVKLAEERKRVLAGQYTINAKITVNKIVGETSTIINFNEKPDIQTTDTKSGWLIQKREIEKKNAGNTKTEVTISMSKNWFSGLFTSYNIPPSIREIKGLGINSIFKKELSPGESLKVTAKTNFIILIIALVIIGFIYYFADNYIREKITLRKSVRLVKTKGGEFALKVSIKVKSRDFVERIRVIDKLPPMVKVFEKYGLAPDKIDHANRRLEWNIQALSRGETRELSYIMYSKIGIVGRFELPRTEAIYEYKSNIKETSSNKVFFEKN